MANLSKAGKMGQMEIPVPDREATNMCYTSMSVEELGEMYEPDEALEWTHKITERRNEDDR